MPLQQVAPLCIHTSRKHWSLNCSFSSATNIVAQAGCILQDRSGYTLLTSPAAAGAANWELVPLPQLGRYLFDSSDLHCCIFSAAWHAPLRWLWEPDKVMPVVGGPAGQQQQQQGHSGTACQLVLVTSLDQSESD
jgi:hypothetical protein